MLPLKPELPARASWCRLLPLRSVLQAEEESEFSRGARSGARRVTWAGDLTLNGSLEEGAGREADICLLKAWFAVLLRCRPDPAPPVSASLWEVTSRGGKNSVSSCFHKTDALAAQGSACEVGNGF